MENQAALGVLALMIMFIVVGLVLMRANVFTGGFVRSMRSLNAALRTRTALISGLALVIVVLLFGITRYGLVNSLPAEKHIERDDDTNRYVITEDKDGCIDMRKLGRSNGVYMAIAPCKPGDKDKNQPH